MDFTLRVNGRKCSQSRKKNVLSGNRTFEGQKPLGLSSGHLPGMVALGPRSANRALRYLHHAGIGLALLDFC